MTSETSLIIPVPAAALVQPFRAQYLHRTGVTMPPHITVQSPFKPSGEITADDHHPLATVCAGFPPFAFTLGHLARFSGTGVLYLAPEPTEPFMALYQALRARFPAPPDNHPTVVFHLFT